MLPKPEPACFVIADISGYTAYLAGAELDHAQDIIADLMDTAVRSFRPRFKLAKFEGDAAFFYAVAEKFDGSLLQDTIESAYFAFRKRLRNIARATSCECKACCTMHQLDLKFVCHHGEFIRQRMGGRDELAGRDVILVHRLLKNDVKARLGDHAYALYSGACIQAMAIDPVAQGLAGHSETIDIIGEVQCWVRDLEVAWTTEIDRRRYLITRKQAAGVIEFDFATARTRVWEYFTVPDLRPKWRAADQVREASTGGRRGVGTTNHCMHGPKAIIEEILDWRPCDYLTLSTLLPAPDAPKIDLTFAFSDNADGGTRVEIRVAKPKPKDKAFVEHAVEHFKHQITGEVAKLRSMLEQDGASAVTDEPAPRVSAERFLTQPMHAH